MDGNKSKQQSALSESDFLPKFTSIYDHKIEVQPETLKQKSKKPKTISLKRITKERDTLSYKLADSYIARELSKGVVDELVMFLLKELNLFNFMEEAGDDHHGGQVFLCNRGDMYRCLQISLLPFIGKEIDADICENIATKVTGGLPAIKKLQPIGQWSYGSEIWAPVEICKSCWGPNDHFNRPRVRIEWLILYGEAVGTRFISDVPHSFIKRFARKLGFPKFRDEPIHHGELVGMWLMGRVGLVNEVPGVVKYDIPSAYQQHNVELRKTREKICLYKRNIKCHLCSVGRDKCPRAVHKFTYKKGKCRKGHIGMLNPEAHPDICVKCAKNLRIAGKMR